MSSGLDWLRRQSFPTRLMMAGAFASISVFAYFTGHIWPWGIVMAIVPLVIGRRSSAEDDFFREAKPTAEAPPVSYRGTIKESELEPLLGRLAAATTAGFGADKLQGVIEGVRSLGPDREKRFQYVVSFARRPVSLQLVLRRKTAEELELSALSDAALIQHLKNA